MKVRKAQIADLNALMALDRAFEEKTGYAASTRAEWNSLIQNETVLLASHWKWAQGFLSASQDLNGITIQKAFVSRLFRHKGVGSALMRNFTAIQNERLASAFLYVSMDNETAIDFYERHGFRIMNADADYLMVRDCA